MAFLAPIFEAVIDVAVTAGSVLADAASTLAASLYSATEAVAVEASVAESVMPGALETEEAVAEGDLLGSAGASKVGEGGSFLSSMYFSEEMGAETLTSEGMVGAETAAEVGGEAEGLATEAETIAEAEGEAEASANTAEETDSSTQEEEWEEDANLGEKGNGGYGWTDRLDGRLWRGTTERDIAEEGTNGSRVGEGVNGTRPGGEPPEGDPNAHPTGADAQPPGEDAAQAADKSSEWKSTFFQVGLLIAGIVPGIVQGEVQQKQAVDRETKEIEAQVRIQEEEMLVQGMGDLFGHTAQ